MELELSNLIHMKKLNSDITFSFQKDIILFKNLLKSILWFLNVFIIIFILIIFLFDKITKLFSSINFTFFKNNEKHLEFYRDMQQQFCDNIHNLYNKEIEEKIILFDFKFNNINFDLFIYNNYDFLNKKIYFNQSLVVEGILNILNAIKFYTNKYKYNNSDIYLIDIGANVGLYTIFFGLLNYSVLSFEPIPQDNYILKKNFCRNNKNYFDSSSSITIINEAIYPIETLCYYYKNVKNPNANIILCDKRKEKNLDKNYIKIDGIKTTKMTNFIRLINDKKIILLRLDLISEGNMFLDYFKERIFKYHIPFIFMQFNLLIFEIHEMRPEDF